jgi:MoaA/NifB/PqqE/SkfB family radical SAM enzyme
MKLSIIYLTRRCPRHCFYCAIRDGKAVGKELNVFEWQKAFEILKELGIDFNLILGNEPWLLGWDLPHIVNHTGIPYALYTSGLSTLFNMYNTRFFSRDGITNLSIGVDYPILESIADQKDDSHKKAMDAWTALKYTRERYPNVETHATITVHKLNYQHLPILIKQLQETKVNININFIQWNNGGGFDFFPSFKSMNQLMFSENDYPKLRIILDEVLQNTEFIQNPQMLLLSFPEMLGMKWHCQGNPYGGPTIDSDGFLRVCGYRKGKYTSKFSIFDLPSKTEAWQQAVYTDAMECPGCSWSCPWMFHFWEEHDAEQGKQVFINHNTKN